jgi:hypothetical protein
MTNNKVRQVVTIKDLTGTSLGTSVDMCRKDLSENNQRERDLSRREMFWRDMRQRDLYKKDLCRRDLCQRGLWERDVCRRGQCQRDLLPEKDHWLERAP